MTHAARIEPAEDRAKAREEAMLDRKVPDELAPRYDLIELLFFAYRDFIADPDRRLADYGFGRAHHRVLHFVDRRPGLTVAELLEILAITKQSLNRVLKELVEKEFVVQRTGAEDRRQRLLYTTPAGHALAVELACQQTKRIARALGGEDAAGEEAAARFLYGMIDPDGRRRIAAPGDDEVSR